MTYGNMPEKRKKKSKDKKFKPGVPTCYSCDPLNTYPAKSNPVLHGEKITTLNPHHIFLSTGTAALVFNSKRGNSHSFRLSFLLAAICFNRVKYTVAFPNMFYHWSLGYQLT